MSDFDPQPGDVFYTSWGYDQTNAEFWQVTRRTKASAFIRRIAATVENGRKYPVAGEFVQDRLLDTDAEKRCRIAGYANLRIDDVRRAYPYEGGGVYDTYAAGHAGH